MACCRQVPMSISTFHPHKPSSPSRATLGPTIPRHLLNCQEIIGQSLNIDHKFLLLNKRNRHKNSAALFIPGAVHTLAVKQTQRPQTVLHTRNKFLCHASSLPLTSTEEQSTVLKPQATMNTPADASSDSDEPRLAAKPQLLRPPIPPSPPSPPKPSLNLRGKPDTPRTDRPKFEVRPKQPTANGSAPGATMEPNPSSSSSSIPIKGPPPRPVGPPPPFRSNGSSSSSPLSVKPPPKPLEYIPPARVQAAAQQQQKEAPAGTRSFRPQQKSPPSVPTSTPSSTEDPPMRVPRPEPILRAAPVLRPPPRAPEPSRPPARASPRGGKDGEGATSSLPSSGPVLRDLGRKAGANPGPAASVALNPDTLIPPSPDKVVRKPKGDVKLSRGRKAYGKGQEEGNQKDVKQIASSRRQNRSSRKAARAEAAMASAPVKTDILEVGKEGMSVQDLARQLAVNDSDVVRCLFLKGIATTVNQTLDEDTVRIVCAEYEVEVIEAGQVAVEELAKGRKEFVEEEDLDKLQSRPPVVTIMGHVDHGKTSLLDYIRKSKVAAGEAGGITQSIGAYRVNVKLGEEEQTCVFLDTPGHEAFSAMRARGARVTDIAVIVVAADDGVRPQSLEAIAHAKAANVPMVVAINKMDKEGANPERVMQELAGHNVMPEAWGGDVPMVPVSALKGTGVEDLLEMIMLQAELQELQANPDRAVAVGTVIEATLDKYRGPVATLLVQNGTLRKGDVVLCGEAYGKVRALTDDTGNRSESAGPSMAVEILGLNTVPVAGDEFRTVASLDEARQLAEARAEQLRLERLTLQAGEGKVSLASVASAVAAAAIANPEGAIEHHSINVVLKVDAQGTVEAIRGALAALPQDTVQLRFLMQSAGEVSSSDVDLAVASEAIVVGFNVGCPTAVQTLADDKGVEVRLYKVIYDLVDDIRKAMEGMLQTKEERVPIGQAEVRAVFGTGSNKVAGCMVTEGKLVKGCKVSVRRGSKEVYSGTLSSLRRVKEAAKEVAAGLECGVGVSDFNEWSDGDVIDAFSVVVKNRTLEEASVMNVAAMAASQSSG